MDSFSMSQGGWKPVSGLRDERADSGEFLVHEDAEAACRILKLAGQAHLMLSPRRSAGQLQRTIVNTERYHTRAR